MLKLKLQYFGHLMQRADSMEKTLVLGKIEGGRRREEQRMRWHHRLSGHEFEQTLGDSEGEGSLACCSPWGRKESDTTQQLNNSNSLAQAVGVWVGTTAYAPGLVSEPLSLPPPLETLKLGCSDHLSQAHPPLGTRCSCCSQLPVC